MNRIAALAIIAFLVGFLPAGAAALALDVDTAVELAEKAYRAGAAPSASS